MRESVLPSIALCHCCGLLQVDLDDMICQTDGQDGHCMFVWPCRCGSRYTLQEADLSEVASSLLVQCQTCSLVIRVLYAIAC